MCISAQAGAASPRRADGVSREPSAAPHTYRTADQRYGVRQLSRPAGSAVPTPAPLYR